MAAEEGVTQANTNVGDQATTTTQSEETQQAPATPEPSVQETTPVVDAKEASKEPVKDLGLLGKTEQAEVKAPEEYSEFKAPEGIAATWDESTIQEFSGIAKEENLTQDEAQKGFNVVSKVLDKLVKENQEAEAKFAEEQAKIWTESPDSDKKTVLAKEALERRPELQKAAAERGYLNDANFVGLLAELGRLESEGKSLTGGGEPSAKPSHPYGPEWH